VSGIGLGEIEKAAAALAGLLQKIGKSVGFQIPRQAAGEHAIMLARREKTILAADERG